MIAERCRGTVLKASHLGRRFYAEEMTFPSQPALGERWNAKKLVSLGHIAIASAAGDVPRRQYQYDFHHPETNTAGRPRLPTGSFRLWRYEM